MHDTAWDVIVIGAGAAGLLAAIRAAELGRRTLLLEKNRRPGVKILMSGGTRCNITHATDNRGIVEAFGPPGRFLHSSLASLSVQDTIDLIEAEGVATKVEPTGKVFPVSNKAADVLDALLRRLHRSGASLAVDEPLRELRCTDDRFALTTSLRTLSAGRAILTTGGRSYPGSGTTGDGYAIAASFGHAIVTPRPALAPIRVAADWVARLRGVTMPDICLRILDGERELGRERGSLLFAHFGLSGPVALDMSGVISRHPRPQTLQLEFDFRPDERETELAEWLRNDSLTSAKKQLGVVLAAHLPRSLSDILLSLAGMPLDRRAAGLSRADRGRLVQLIKRLRVPIVGTLGFEKAEVTTGGVALDEVDSGTMCSKWQPGFFIAGEVLDLDGPIGGYNFQAAFSTGWLAGTAAAKCETEGRS
jgi:predicted Rossmann fold flavoprotein